jgi:DNA gyrase/topoisomerase IV subunit A
MLELLRAEFIREFDLSALQANAILAMPLRQLTQLAQLELETTYKEALRKTQDLLDILNSEVRMTKRSNGPNHCHARQAW